VKDINVREANGGFNGGEEDGIGIMRGGAYVCGCGMYGGVVAWRVIVWIFIGVVGVIICKWAVPIVLQNGQRLFGVGFTVGVAVRRLVWNERGRGIVVSEDGGFGLGQLGELGAQ
jgi:hypothetical protein